MRAAALLLLALLLPANVHAQEAAASARGGATAAVVDPLRIEYLRDLAFGSLTVGTAGEGAVTVSPAPAGAAPRYTGSAAPLCSGGTGADCAPYAAQIAVRGEPGRSYRVDLPASVMASGRATGRQLAVEDLVVRSRERPLADRRGRLDPQGRDTLEIGGTLRVPAATPADHFRAELAVFVAYD
ncbi:DUF4402 domain-containing protein [Aurantiacibacter luteus]|uniref:DUF4402 domain-containing protein n=1 Tax=Aurantiacibacter luteus TaxID=1581420 RepID=A0A0G9MTU8_9SPHN|nr:DUF4402 domain-containing protein [Aurantiacibacter luteus]KLE34157.1 hypothetical protein AAW00_07730 [Aurantiacibacter luteus]